MVDPKDSGTVEILAKPAKRGRPATGKAMTAAERKKASLQGDFPLTASGNIDWSAVSKTRLVAMITMPHPEADVAMWYQFHALAELARRAGLGVADSGARSRIIYLPEEKA